MLDEGEQGLRADRSWNMSFSIEATASKPVWLGLWRVGVSTLFALFADEGEGAGEYSRLPGVARLLDTSASAFFSVGLLLFFGSVLAGVDRFLGTTASPFFSVDLLLFFDSEDGRHGRDFRLRGAG